MAGLFSASPFGGGGFGAGLRDIPLQKRHLPGPSGTPGEIGTTSKIPMEQAAAMPSPTQALRGFGGGSIFRQVPLRMGQAAAAAPGGPVPSGGIPQTMPAPQHERAREQGPNEAKLVDRLCVLIEKFSDKDIDPEIASRIFWSYLDHAKVPPEVALPKVQERCPGLTIPARPAKPAAELKRPEKEGFRGKTSISYEEAKELADLLDVVLAPLTPEEAAKELAKEECLRELTEAAGFPIVERLQERLQEFLSTAAPTDTFEISHGETVVTGKAVECAEALGRIKTIRTIVTAGGITVGGGALLLLLGVL